MERSFATIDLAALVLADDSLRGVTRLVISQNRGALYFTRSEMKLFLHRRRPGGGASESLEISAINSFSLSRALYILIFNRARYLFPPEEGSSRTVAFAGQAGTGGHL